MSISGIGLQTSLLIQSLVDTRSQLTELQRQLATGKKSDTYAGIGVDRGLAIGLRSQMSTLDAFDDSITNVGVRLDVAQSALDRMDAIGRDVRAATAQGSTIDSNGSTTSRSLAMSGLEEILGLLNAKAGDRYLFSGRAADRPAVESLDHIMNGNGAQAGFLQVLAERTAADLGTDGLGRLAVAAPSPTSVSLAEDVAGSPFGFKLAGVSATSANVTVSGPAGAPPAISVGFAANPNPGDTVQVRLTLPDGSSEAITLKATTASPPGADEFTIGATPAETAANFQSTLTTSVGKLAATALPAASAVAAAADFFGDPPQRVGSTPPGSATSLVAGTSADTVIWYTGENGPDPARSTATARVDPSIAVSYGLRANEEGIRTMVQNLAALAAVTFSPTGPNATAASAALNERIGANIAGQPGVQTVKEIESELATAHNAVAAASDRHKQTKNTLAGMLDQIEGVPPEEVAAKILAVQTRLQASLQTTSMLYQTSLVNYL